MLARALLAPLRLGAGTVVRATGGRPWLVALLVLGCGVIFLHASTLKTNQTIDERAPRVQALERDNAALRARVSGLGSVDRVVDAGGALGLAMPDPDGVGYLDGRAADAARAAAGVRPPSADWQPDSVPDVPGGDASPGLTRGTPEERAAAAADGTAAPDSTPATGAAAAAPAATGDGAATDGQAADDGAATGTQDGAATGTEAGAAAGGAAGTGAAATATTSDAEGTGSATAGTP